MFTTILGALALLAIIAAIVFMTPADPWPLDGEMWFERLTPRTGRDTLAEELAIMRLDMETEAIAAARQPQSGRATVPSFGDVAPGAGQLGAPNRSW